MLLQLKWGLILGGAVAAQSLLFGALGLHRIYNMQFAYLAIAIAINVTCVALCLRESIGKNGWVRQVFNGLAVGAIASVLIFMGSWLVTSVVFPNYFVEMAEGYRGTLLQMGVAESVVDDRVAGIERTIPARAAFDGVIGTIVVSWIAAAFVAIWWRKTEDR